MDARLLPVCQEFEAVMLRPLFSSMKFSGSLPLADEDSTADDAAGPTGSDDLLQSLFVETMGGAFARAGGMGFAAELARSLGERPA